METGKSNKLGVIAAVLVLVAVVAVSLAAYTVINSSGQSPASTTTGTSSRTSGMGSSSSSSSTSSAAAAWSDSELKALEVTDAYGNEMTLGEFCDGRVTVINMWATWCPYCIDEMQDYQALYDKFGEDIQFVMLDAADSGKEVASARDYVADEGFTFPVFYDMNHRVRDHFVVRAYPTTIVIDSDGEVLANTPGRIDAAAFEKSLASLL